MGGIQNMAKQSYKVTSGNIKPGTPQGKGQISLLAWSCKCCLVCC